MDLFKRKVILDTNFLLIPGQFKVNVFAEIERVMDVPYHLCIIDKTVDELKKSDCVWKYKRPSGCKARTCTR